MRQDQRGTREIFFWGIFFAIVFLYAYEIALTLSVRPVGLGDDIYEPRFAYGAWSRMLSSIRKLLISLSFPSYAISINMLPSDPYFDNCIYFPFLAGLQWFVYGCVFGWWRSRVRFRKASSEMR
jgi:hypothetical protein